MMRLIAVTVVAASIIFGGSDVARADVTWFTMQGDTLTTTGNWEADEEFSFKIMTDDQRRLEFPFGDN